MQHYANHSRAYSVEQDTTVREDQVLPLTLTRQSGVVLARLSITPASRRQDELC